MKFYENGDFFTKSGQNNLSDNSDNLKIKYSQNKHNILLNLSVLTILML